MRSLAKAGEKPTSHGSPHVGVKIAAAAAFCANVARVSTGTLEITGPDGAFRFRTIVPNRLR